VIHRISIKIIDKRRVPVAHFLNNTLDPRSATERAPERKGISDSLGETEIGNPTRSVFKVVTDRSPTQVKYQFQIDGRNPIFIALAKQKSSAAGLMFSDITKIAGAAIKLKANKIAFSILLYLKLRE
jgi:hypothetical protein